jgi:carbamoyl-phosphate synthase/aspartate carbamoyltransferase/dihydroorotase
MLTAVTEKRLTLERLVTLMHTNPKRIFNLPDQPDTYIEVDPATHYTLSNDELQTKCGWSPFAGLALQGRVQRVTLRGRTVYDATRLGKENKILAQPGSGCLIP